jgi:hypothetical protein
VSILKDIQIELHLTCVLWPEFIHLQINNNNESHLDFYLSSVGYALTGDSTKEQNFWYFRGQTAENGKSLIFEVLEKLMPNLVMKANKDFMDKGADLRKEVNTWRGIYLLWCNEVSTKPKDEDLMKAIGDGTGFKYNPLYNVNAVTMPISFKLFAVSQNSLTIKCDAGVIRRFLLGQFNSQFRIETTEDDIANLQFVRDKDLSSKLQEKYKHALLHLIFTYSNHYWNEKKLRPYPEEWKREKQENVQDNNKFEAWFNETFEIGSTFSISKKDYEQLLSLSTLKDIRLKDELVRMKIWFEYKSQERRDGAKGWYYGFKECPTPPRLTEEELNEVWEEEL